MRLQTAPTGPGEKSNYRNIYLNFIQFAVQGEVPFIELTLRRHQPEKNRGQRNIDSLSSSKGRDALCNTPIHNQFLREKSFFGIEKHLEWSTQLWSNVLFIYHLFTAPFTALNAHRVSLFCGVGVTEVLEPSILKTDECGSVIR